MNNLNEALAMLINNINNGVEGYLPEACKQLLHMALMKNWTHLILMVITMWALCIGIWYFYKKGKQSGYKDDEEILVIAFFACEVFILIPLVLTIIDIYQINNLPQGYLLSKLSGVRL